MKENYEIKIKVNRQTIYKQKEELTTKNRDKLKLVDEKNSIKLENDKLKLEKVNTITKMGGPMFKDDIKTKKVKLNCEDCDNIFKDTSEVEIHL